MKNDHAVHVGVPIEREPVPVWGSRCVPCARCGEGVWIKPNACAEIPERTHTHSCDVCVARILTRPNN